jgi:HlyD family type I secretion membrane fusion protein
MAVQSITTVPRHSPEESTAAALALLGELASRRPRTLAAQPASDSNAPAVSDSIKSAGIAGWAIIAIFFGIFGTWAAVAPLNGAVVAEAVIKVQGNRKSVQHLDGGIVKELRVKEGSQVAVGDVLIVLDETQARAEHEVLSQQYMVLRATEARLMAELNRGSELVLPPEIKARMDEPDVKGIWNGQIQQFESRRVALEGQRSVIQEKINQLKAQISGGEKQIVSFKQQLQSTRKELDSIIPLVERGLIAQPRRLQLERSSYGLEAQIEDMTANIAKFRQAIAEQVQSAAQLDNDRMAEVSKDLRDTQAKLLEVIPRLMNAKAALGRMEIRSPYAGQVVALSVFAVGAVIQRGDKILDIVPGDDSLTIEAQVAVEDISEVHPGMRAEVHLTAYKQRITPMVHGDVIQVSADRLTDNRTGKPYYTALVRVDEKELADLPNVKLYPGMPATVMIPTTQRTAFQYLVGPLVMSFNHAFRQK